MDIKVLTSEGKAENLEGFFQRIEKERAARPWYQKLVAFIWWQPKNAVENWYYERKWATQRFFRGYSEADTWNFDSEEFRRMYLPFKKFVQHQKEHGHGHPGYFNSLKEWHDVLDFIERGFDLCMEEYEGTDAWFAKTPQEHWRDELIIRKAFEVYGRYFQAFWD